MAATNIWQQFKALIPAGIRAVITITANKGNSTSQAQEKRRLFRMGR